MRVIPVRDWHQASQRIGAYPFAAQSLDEAIERMKRKWPGKTPTVCYWHKVTEKINKYGLHWSFTRMNTTMKSRTKISGLVVLLKTILEQSPAVR